MHGINSENLVPHAGTTRAESSPMSHVAKKGHTHSATDGESVTNTEIGLRYHPPSLQTLMTLYDLVFSGCDSFRSCINYPCRDFAQRRLQSGASDQTCAERPESRFRGRGLHRLYARRQSRSPPSRIYHVIFGIEDTLSLKKHANQTATHTCEKP